MCGKSTLILTARTAVRELCKHFDTDTKALSTLMNKSKGEGPFWGSGNVSVEKFMTPVLPSRTSGRSLHNRELLAGRLLDLYHKVQKTKVGKTLLKLKLKAT